MPVDNWEGDWDPSSATAQPKDKSEIGRMKIATSSLKEMFHKFCVSLAGLSQG